MIRQFQGYNFRWRQYHVIIAELLISSIKALKSQRWQHEQPLRKARIRFQPNHRRATRLLEATSPCWFGLIQPKTLVWQLPV